MKRAQDKTEPALEDTAEQLFELLDKAVADRLQADVDIGCFLSGGIDSAAIVSQATKLRTTDTQQVGKHGTNGMRDRNRILDFCVGGYSENSDDLGHRSLT